MYKKTMSLARILFSRRLFTADNFYILRKFSSQNALNLSEPAVQGYLKQLMFEHEHLCLNMKRSAEENRRLFQIKPIVNVLEQRVTLYDNIETLKEQIKNHITMTK